MKIILCVLIVLCVVRYDYDLKIYNIYSDLLTEITSITVSKYVYKERNVN